MTADRNLPSPRLADSAWEEAPPGPLERPGLYDGLAWRRVVGYLVDLAVLAVLYGCAWLIVGLVGVLSFGLLTPFGVVLLAVLPVAYHGGCVGRWGATPGMRLMDLEVRDWTGAPPGYLQGFLAAALFYVSVAATMWLVLVVALLNDRRRTLHDFLAGIVVVRRTGPEAAARP